MLPIEKLSAAFGIPAALDDVNPLKVDAGELCYADWYLSLQSLSPALTAEEKDDDDRSLQFLVKAQGEDGDMLTSLASYCLLNAVVQQSECYSVQTPTERVVQCEIVHHAAMTEHLLAYLEKVLEGVRFMSHYELPFCVEDEDAELLYFSRRVTRHPLSVGHNLGSVVGEGKGDTSLERKDEGKYDSSADSKNGLIGSFRVGHGSLIGIDLDMVCQSMVITDQELCNTDMLPPDLAKCVRPLEERMQFFSGGRVEDFEEASWLFSLIHRMQYLANNTSVDGADSDIDLDPRDGDNDQDSYLGENETDTVEDAAQQDRILRNNAKLDSEYRDAEVKIVDLGNACWTYKHFTDDIQTRQYRAPEVLVGAPYDTSADMWSLACIVFELLTGDLMFDPQAGKNWSREEDHLALMMELLGKFPVSLLPKGKFSWDYFTKKGELKHIHHLNFWGLEGVLVEKYKFSEEDAAEVTDFLLGMLEV